MNQRQATKFMKRALVLAAKGAGTTHPNPMVGAVVVASGAIVGEGWHRMPGEPHAEAIAIQEAGAAANGGALFVSLEPCSHSGRTPPCTEAIIDSGIDHVYAACGDPHPLVDGRGFRTLENSGVGVTTGILQREAEDLNRAFFRAVREGTPYVTLKMAMTLDGRIADHAGDSRWISGEKARKFVHGLRSEVDAVLVGAGTVKADNPRLTARGAGRVAQPLRIVLDPALRTPRGSAVLQVDSAHSTLLVHGEDVPAVRGRPFEESGVKLLGLPLRDGAIQWKELAPRLVERGLFHILMEGGGRTAAWALREQAVSRLELFIAPRILGADGIPAVGALGKVPLADAVQLSLRKVRRAGEDLHITAELI